jgi:hypothetical protein
MCGLRVRRLAFAVRLEQAAPWESQLVGKWVARGKSRGVAHGVGVGARAVGSGSASGIKIRQRAPPAVAQQLLQRGARPDRRRLRSAGLPAARATASACGTRAAATPLRGLRLLRDGGGATLASCRCREGAPLPDPRLADCALHATTTCRRGGAGPAKWMLLRWGLLPCRPRLRCGTLRGRVARRAPRLRRRRALVLQVVPLLDGAVAGAVGKIILAASCSRIGEAANGLAVGVGRPRPPIRRRRRSRGTAWHLRGLGGRHSA